MLKAAGFSWHLTPDVYRIYFLFNINELNLKSRIWLNLIVAQLRFGSVELL